MQFLALDNVVVTPHLAASTDEAQDRAGVIVAEQVAAALGGRLVANTVNIPVIGAEELEALGPYVPLAGKLGRIAMELTGGRADEVTITTYGGLADYDTRLLTVAALNGLFQGRADRPVNYVNAPLIARERGIEVKEERSQSARDYTNLLRVEIRNGDEQTRVAGTLIGRDDRQWLVSALGFDLELELAPLLVLFRYDDVPGVIGRVGTLFGDAGVNIANMTVSRSRRGGKALIVLSVDSMPPPSSWSVSARRASTTRVCSSSSPRSASARVAQPVERIAAVLRAQGVERTARGVRGGDADERPRRGQGGRLRGGADREEPRLRVRRAAGARARAGRPAGGPRQGRGSREKGYARVASASEVLAATGFEPGGVAPFPVPASRTS